MERLKQRLKISRDALETLEQILDQPFSPIVRDAAIQRFEYTFESIWKAAQLYLHEKEGIEAGSPKTVIRGCHAVKIFDDSSVSLAMEMTDHRNLTVHTYNESLAYEIYENLGSYAGLMKHWLAAMEKI